MASRQIETKVSVPVIATLGLGTLLAALLAVAQAFGLDLTEEQLGAIKTLAAASGPLVMFGIGYLVPHTARDAV